MNRPPPNFGLTCEPKFCGRLSFEGHVPNLLAPASVTPPLHSRCLDGSRGWTNLGTQFYDVVSCICLTSYTTKYHVEPSLFF